MATTEYEPDVTVMGREALRHGALRPLGVRVVVRGRLHLCLANIGKSPLLMWPKGLGAITGAAARAPRRVPPAPLGAPVPVPLGAPIPAPAPCGTIWAAGRGMRLLVVLALPACLAGNAGARRRGDRRCGDGTVRLGASEQHGAAGETGSAHGAVPERKPCFVRMLFFPEPAGCFYFIYLISRPINVQ